MSDAEVARRAGLTERRYAHYVAGTREPDLQTLLTVCDALATTPNDLLGRGKADGVGDPRNVAVARLLGATSNLSVDDLAIAALQVEAFSKVKRPARAVKTRKLAR